MRHAILAALAVIALGAATHLPSTNTATFYGGILENHLVPEGYTCTWSVWTEGGSPPYTYSWGGIGSGTNATVTVGPLYVGGTLSVTVTDDNDEQFSESIVVQPGSWPNSGHCW